ncbi:sacsin N-terminal ATP-binding-like domain-containing protein [Streptomyces tirandamycinicus]|uniref:DEAD/DEAH box helicase n=1 Tax=Streptomyces tirandamycinicus TaxID=2174846 RepID=UPI002271FB6F|nr:DEAD/DEAH box helicase [Streptomyces tirandamycinicus]MCY0984200.1 DEAD/DEAH box helicase [Streptomyces tirandamycinicus]
MSDRRFDDPSIPPVIAIVLQQSATVLKTYQVDPGLVQEHANGERRITQGGYGERQLFELVQNAADEIAAQPGGKLHVVLTEKHLYCANEGAPVTPEGAETILRMSVSRKRGGQIGRFGVGVKSVLSVCDTPQFFSRTAAHGLFGFGFDRNWSAGEIARAIGREGDIGMDTPVLRMARPLDVEQERADDGILDKLLRWATTVVRLPLLPGAAERLGRDINGHRSRDGRETEPFPSHFQLLSPHVGQVLLRDERILPIVRREISVEYKGVHRTLREVARGAKQTTEQWKVYTVAHSPSAEVADSAGELHSRPELDISWAVPEYTIRNGLHHVPSGRGTFWAFFPTKYEVSLTGILNAPWKTNEDRQHLLDGSPFNRELLRVAARLVVDTLPSLVPAEDPAAYLPLLPGRAKEKLNWADEYFLRQFWSMAARSPSLPDQNGVLRVPEALLITPPVLEKEWLRIWSEYPHRPDNWIHPSVDAADTALRRGKMMHILDAADKRPEGVKDWLEALVADGTAEASSRAIHILSLMLRKHSGEAASIAIEARKAKIVLTEDHGMVAPIAGEIFHRTSDDALRDDMVYVDRRISDRPEMAQHLHAIGIRVADAQGRFEGVLDQGFDHYDDKAWANFWLLLRSAGGTAQVNRIQAKVPKPAKALRVRTVDGRFRPMRDCLLPGPVVPGDGSRDRAVAVDLEFHESDRAVLRELGLSDRPTTGHKPDEDAWFEEYRQSTHDRYLRTLPANAPRPKVARLSVWGGPTAGPLHLLPSLSGEGQAAFLAALPESGVVQHWQMQYGSQSTTRRAVQSPMRWVIDRHGLVRTSLGLVRVSEAVGPQLKEFSTVLPVADIGGELARKLMLPTTADEVPADRWGKLLERVRESEDDAFIGRAYALLFRVGFEFPEGVLTRCRVGSTWEERPDDEIAVATAMADFKELVRERLPALLVADKSDAATAQEMIETWGMSKVSDVVSKELVTVKIGRTTPLFEEFTTVRARLGSSGSNYRIQRCSELNEVVRTPTGHRQNPLKAARKGSTLYVLDSLDRIRVLEAADREFKWGFGARGCEQALALQTRQEQDQQLQARLKAVRENESIIDKIALLIGEEALRGMLPPGLMESELDEHGVEPDTRRVAEMAFNAHGEAILRVHSRDLAQDFPTRAPSSFNGNDKALRFVTDLGFPDSFAGAQVPSLEPRLEVEGPSEFPALHPYQEELAQALLGLLENPVPQRGMMSLPTGAGKTRVTAEGVIRWIRDGDVLPGPVLWIAQTAELCEQAVQSWKFVWSKVGPEMPLVISRLWSTNEATPVDGRPHLVVATDAKLDRCLDTHDYTWLRDSASLVIIDEAHTAMSSRFTTLLSHLGLTHHRTSRHLVGLTATPYRNNEELTRLLVQRFGARLDTGVFDGDLAEAIKKLQYLGVLAQVKHRELTGGRISLTADELAASERFTTLPKGAEQRLAEDHDRNQRIVDEIADMPSDWPVLVFATSVAHAKFLAAKLGDRGIKAAAIDSTTPPNERRKQVDDFRKRRIQVLTNYGVLTQGFDAPATRAVVVARPTYSANIYQQMIGRGLRGPKNGGKDICLILNVRDNITNFGEELAFTEFEYLWSAAQ